MEVRTAAMTPYDVLGRIRTPIVSVEIRDNFIEQGGDLLIASHEVLLGSPLSSIPKPSMSRSAVSDRGAYGHVGDVILMPSDVPWRFRSGSGRFQTVTGVFDRELFRSTTGRGDDWSERELRQCHNIRDARIAGALARLASEVRAPSFASEVMVEGLGLCLLADLARFFDGGAAPAAEQRGLTLAQLRRVEECVRETKGRQPTLSELSAFCGLGQRTFMRRFKAATGQNVGPWISDQRIAAAKQMLRAGHMSIKEIAYELGFSSASNFSSAFRRAVSASPRAFAEGRDD